MSYIELHAKSAFSFLRGASFPEHLAEHAAALGLPAIALLDRNGVYGAQRFSVACREHGVRPIIGASLTMEDGVELPVLVENRTGYANLCSLLTEAHLRSAVKGECAVSWGELAQFAEGLIGFLGSTGRRPVASGGSPDASAERKHSHFSGTRMVRTISGNHSSHSVRAGLRRAAANDRPAACAPQLAVHAQHLLKAFGRDRVYVELQRHLVRGEERINRELIDLAEHHRLPLLATNGVLHASAAGREVLDVFTCIREHTHLDAAGTRLAKNDERHLKSAQEMKALFRDQPNALTNTLRLADRLEFSLENIGYHFPDYPVPDGHSMDSFLRTLVLFGAQQRYESISSKVKKQLEFELALIRKLGFSGYFLIVWDIVNFCRENNVMVQGRGSAANSAVCFCLGITPVDPVSNNLVFERFLNESRKGWPDIDLDLPSGDRRESVIQEVYRRYGKHGAAMTANVITYRGRSAAREIGKALNFSPNILDRFSHLFASGDFPHTLDLQSQIEQAGLPKKHPRMAAFVRLYQAIYGLPRHLGQHSGGMIICQNQLSRIVPLENASMPGRVVAQWDKDDCEDLGIVKVDLLGLGMMSVMQDTLELCREQGRPLDLAHIPKDDPATYEIMQTADTIGVFQIESRAQMATLPRMKPKCFYDVVIEVAIIRPGPIQGDMVHPYLARRAGKEPVTYFDERLRPVLERTLGVPLFQEQMLKIAMVMADFSGEEAEELRRALSFHRSQERMEKVSVKLRAAMAGKGVAPEIIEKIIHSITSFALYGFPESHAISFAILAYGSAYLKVHRAPEFYASLLNNQPMGFYSPATIVKDAHRHGVKILPVSVMESDWRCSVVRLPSLPRSARASLPEEERSADEGPVSNVIRRELTRTACQRQISEGEESVSQVTQRRSRPTLCKGQTSKCVGSVIPADDPPPPAPGKDGGEAPTRVEHAVRLGFCVVKGLRQEHGEEIVRQRQIRPFQSLEDFKRRTGLTKEELRTLAELGALNPLAGHRRAALWESEKLLHQDLFEMARSSDAPRTCGSTSPRRVILPHDQETSADHASPLSPMTLPERVQADYNTMELTTGPHPMKLLRDQLPNVWRAGDLATARHGSRVTIAGNVICRQRPGTAKGFVFVSLEDETGVSNAIVTPDLFERFRLTITEEPFLLIEGEVQNTDQVVLIKARRIRPLTQAQIGGSASHDFR